MKSQKLKMVWRLAGSQPKYAITSCLEKRKAYEYLRNLINSRYRHDNSVRLLSFANALLGKNICATAIARDYADQVDKEEFAMWMKERRYSDAPISAVVAKNILREEIAPLLASRLKKMSLHHDADLEARIAALSRAFDLTFEQREILLFFFLIKRTSQTLQENLNTDDGVGDFSKLFKLNSSGYILLGLPRTKFLKALNGGALIGRNLLEEMNHQYSQLTITNWCGDYLLGIRPLDITSDLFEKVQEVPFEVGDFNVSLDELAVLHKLMTSKSSANILLYGAAGTGRSSFAASLAKKYGKELYSVKVPETDVIDRIRNAIATTNLTDKVKSLVLIDDADEMLDTIHSRFDENATNRSLINTVLDMHDKKIIWITSRCSGIDPSTMRRFAFTVEFKKFDSQRRLAVLRHELKQTRIGEDFFPESVLNDLSKNYEINAGSIVNAIAAAGITRRSDKKAALKRVMTVLANHEKAIGAGKVKHEMERTFDHYLLDGMNASINLSDVVSALRHHCETPTVNAAVSLLLHGMPGTGKSEFAYYLGYLLKKNVLLKRACEIQSKWVGETEKNIAEAFGESKSEGSILFFDEADSFLYPRASAQHSWEKSFTNEILTQLENHRGVVIFATNDLDGLDHAALRRFRFKIRFNPLTPEGILSFYNAILKPLVTAGGDTSDNVFTQLQQLKRLTPGDFAVVKERILLMKTVQVTHDSLIIALKDEIMYKRDSKNSIGFRNA